MSRLPKRKAALGPNSTCIIGFSARLIGVVFSSTDDEIHRIITRAASSEAPTPWTLTSPDLADLMGEIRKLGGTQAALAIFDIIDGCGGGYATHTPEVFHGLLRHCTANLGDRVVEDILER